MCEGLILDGSVIGLLLVLVARRFDKEPRQSLDDDAFLLVVELLPQVRLRNRDLVEVQIQLRHGSPGCTRYYWHIGRAAQESIDETAKTQQVIQRADERRTLWSGGGG